MESVWPDSSQYHMAQLFEVLFFSILFWRILALLCLSDYRTYYLLLSCKMSLVYLSSSILLLAWEGNILVK